MTNQEARSVLLGLVTRHNAFSKESAAICKAIDVLRQTDGELISRQAAFIALNKRAENVSLKTRIGLLDAVRVIDELPSVEPERKPGKWEWDQRTGEYVCSECGCNPIYERTTPDVSEIDKYRYCRWCGSRMEVDG